MNAKSIWMPRMIVLVSSLIFGIIVLGLCAHVRSKPSLGTNCGFDIMGVVTASLSILLFPTMLMFSRTIIILTELSALCIVWILWVVSAALAIEARNDVLGPFSCDIFPIARGRTSCHEMIAIEAISIIIFVLLLVYMLPLCGYAVFAYFHEENSGIWHQRVNELCASTNRHTEIKGSPSATQ